MQIFGILNSVKSPTLFKDNNTDQIIQNVKHSITFIWSLNLNNDTTEYIKAKDNSDDIHEIQFITLQKK